MRILVLTSIIFSLIYIAFPSKKAVNEIDSVKVKLAAPKRKRLPLNKKISRPVPMNKENVLPQKTNGPKLVSGKDSTAEDEGELSHSDESGANDHEKSWQDELSQILMSLEPEYGEEIFNSYLNERSQFQSSLDELVRDGQNNQDLDILIAELENQHEERVKDILGRHYEEIKELEAKFLDSDSR